jgi:hypothetical protein
VTSSDPTTRDTEFRQFAGGFGDALNRLAVLLVDDSNRADALVVRSLAVLRRRWAGIDNAGAPEAQAVDILVSLLPRSGVSAPLQLPDAGLEEDVAVDVTLQRQQAILRSWSVMRPRERAGLLFTDASVVSPRLAGAPAPRSLGSPARVQARAAESWRNLESRVRADAAATDWNFDDDEFGVLLADSLRAKASTIPTFLPQLADITRRRRRDLRQTLLAAAGVVVVIVLAGVAVVHFSASHGAGNAAAAGVSPSGIVPPLFTNVQPPARSAVATPKRESNATAVDNEVVDWPIRGTLASDATLGSEVIATFVTNHPGATGRIQLLLLTDTPTFRVAYVRAQTPDGSIGAWFYGDIGSETLVEGASDLGFSILGPDTVISAVLVHDSTRELVTLSSPTARSMVLHGGSDPASFLVQDGVGILDISRLAENGGLQVAVTQSDGTSSVALPQTVNLDQQLPEIVGDTTAGYPTMRGSPDPSLLIAADVVATKWQADELHDDAVPDVLWGGDDGEIGQVVVRLRTTGPLDVAVIAWSGPTPGSDSELLDPTAPDFPLIWDYPDGDRTRIGVLVPIGVATVQLRVDDAVVQTEPADQDGYASVVLPTGVLGEQGLSIVLSDAAGKQVTTLPVQSPS